MKTKLLILSFLLTSAIAMSQVAANQVDDFEDGTTQNWGVGGGASNPPTNIATGGPNGTDDNFLSYTTTGNPGGPGSKMIIFSLDNQWSGNFTSENIVGIRFDVKVLGADLMLRIALSDQDSAGPDPTQIVTTNAVAVTAGTGWTTVTIPISSSDFTYLLGPNSINYVLANTSEMRILHNSNATWVGSAIGATLQLDNITALTSLGVNEQNLAGDFKILQNPASSRLILSLPRSSSEIKLDVFDVLGKKIVTKQLSGVSSSIDISKWNSGVYLVRLSSDNITQTKRFIKQ
ncbi:MAG: T9SS type A sorting domain-containing protein [Gelidibacter sp.]